jgi:hypothetical protein
VPVFESILEALNDQGVRYVIVGGLAVVLHGHARLTADLDLAVDPAPSEALKSMQALHSAGLQPRLPVDAIDFADASTRKSWGQRQMRIFSMFDPYDPLREVDVFVENPIDFNELWARSEVVSLGATVARIASIDDLITMKREAGRPQDLADIEALEVIREAGDSHE